MLVLLQRIRLRRPAASSSPEPERSNLSGSVRRCLAGLLALLCLPCLTGALCGPSIAVADEATALPPPIASEKDLVYAVHEDQELRCDVYLPPVRKPGLKYPAALVIHGGAWATGSKFTMVNYAVELARAGIVAVAIDYRHAPISKFPAQVDDVRAALIWLREKAEQYDIDTERVGLFGYSAGGHLACMIATLQDEPRPRALATSAWALDDPRWDKLPKVCATVAGGPPCEFRELPPHSSGLAYFLGGTRSEKPEAYQAASPVAFASPGDCPILFIHGDRDLIVPIQSSQSLFQSHQALGVPSEFLTVEKQGHMVVFLHSNTRVAATNYLADKLRCNPLVAPVQGSVTEP